MTGDPTLDAVISGLLALVGVGLVFEISVSWARSALLGRRGGGWDGPE